MTTDEMKKMNSIPELIEDIRAGKMILLVDDEDRENEGDLIIAADYITPETVNFMAREARGLICLSLTGQQIEQLKLPLMVKDEVNYSPNKTAFTVSIEASQGVTTGISAADRAHTVKVAANPNAKPNDIITPGHIFPIRAQDGGVIRRAGHTEGSIDLARLAGLNPAAVICEVMNEDGTMARVPELFQFAKKHGIRIGTIADLIRYRLETETHVEEVARKSDLPSFAKDVTLRVFRNRLDNSEHFVLQKGLIKTDEPNLIRIQAQNPEEDFVLGLAGVPSRLRLAFQRIEEAGSGVIVFLRSNMDMSSLGDDKDYGLGAQILRALGVKQIKLLSNRATKRAGIRGYGLEITEMVELTADDTSRATDELADRLTQVVKTSGNTWETIQ